jgi:hypothetical protein
MDMKKYEIELEASRRYYALTTEEQHNIDMDNLVDKAKLAVFRAYNEDPRSGREWIETDVDNTGKMDAGYKLKLYTLAGSPPKGYILVSYYHGYALAIDAWFGKIHLYKKSYDTVGNRNRCIKRIILDIETELNQGSSKHE